MANLFMKAWKDPVWSKVISAGILAIIAGVARLVAHYKGSTIKYVSYPIPLWLALMGA